MWVVVYPNIEIRMYVEVAKISVKLLNTFESGSQFLHVLFWTHN